MNAFYVNAPGMRGWQPIADQEHPVPTGEVQWRGRTFDLANVIDVVELTEALADDDQETQDILDQLTAEHAAGQTASADVAAAAAINEQTALIEAENERLRVQIAHDDARAAEKAQELHDQGISTAPAADVAQFVAQWKRENADVKPSGTPPHLQSAIRDHHKRYGF